MFSKFTKGGKASKPATKVVKKVAKAAAPIKRSVSGTKGWLGGDGGAQDLDKWYGECTCYPPLMLFIHQGKQTCSSVYIPGFSRLSKV